MLRPSAFQSLSLLAALAAPVTFAACSSSTTTTTTHDAGKPSSHDAGSDAHTASQPEAGTSGDATAGACSAQAAATCSTLQRCDPPSLTAEYGDLATCITRQSLSCLAAFGSPGTGNTVAATTACAAATTSESCADDLDNTPPSACAQAHGTVQAGGACSHSAECASGFCAIAPQNVCGTCQSTPTAGASCATLTTCGQGLACVKDICVQYVKAVGGTCGATQPCGTGLACVTAADAGSGTCQTNGTTVGAACDPKLEVAPGCNATLGLSCDSSKTSTTYKTCQTSVQVTAGMPCGSIDGIENVCTSESTCLEPNPDAGHQCIARAADDASCNTVTGPACITPSRCVGTIVDGGSAGKCTPPVSACP